MVSVFPNAAGVTQAAADYVQQRAALSIRERGCFRLALSGGSTPRGLYRLLAAEYKDRIEWRHVQVFMSDERCVAADHPDSNFRMASENLLERVGVGEVRRVACELGVDEAALRYAEALGSEPMDLVLLGMGYDGHTASLFPGAVFESGRRVVHTHSPVPPHDRITMSLKAINEARAVAFLVMGAGKAARLAGVRAQMANGSATLPAARVRPGSGELVWFVDSAAAGE
jgi:6-phosphogluconolactonase